MTLADQEISDRLEIEQLLVRYCYAIDRRDWDAYAVSTMLIDLDGDKASARTVCHCPVVLDRGNGETQMFFQGLWYLDELTAARRRPGGGGRRPCPARLRSRPPRFTRPPPAPSR